MCVCVCVREISFNQTLENVPNFKVSLHWSVNGYSNRSPTCAREFVRQTAGHINWSGATYSPSLEDDKLDKTTPSPPVTFYETPPPSPPSTPPSAHPVSSVAHANLALEWADLIGGGGGVGL